MMKRSSGIHELKKEMPGVAPGIFFFAVGSRAAIIMSPSIGLNPDRLQY